MIAGIDEAGKGCVIGPLVVAGVACESDDLLKALGVKDSKKLPHNKRVALDAKIREIAKVEIVKVQARELDERMGSSTINEILKECYAEIIKKLKPDLAYVDSPDVIPSRLSSELEKMTGIRVVAEHGADGRYVVVAAASIIAKVEREREIEKLKQVYGDFGSGYASDPRTREFLKKCIATGKLPACVRKRWQTVANLAQRTLDDFGW